MACYYAKGSFLPTYYIFKKVNKHQVWEENMPPGAIIKMNWLTNHFKPRMPTGNCFLILDGHGSQIISCKMLENAQTNNIILLCPPRHTAYFLQPFDRSFFKSLKKYFKRACDKFIRANPGKRIECWKISCWFLDTCSNNWDRNFSFWWYH